jgi:hypothetical protein
MIRNAKIVKTTLGVEDHGIFSAWLHVDFGGSGQGFGGYALDGKPAKRNGQSIRRGTAFGCDFITGILRTLEVDTWEKLPGTFCRVDGSDGLANRIGHLLKEQWFDPNELAARSEDAGEGEPS